MVVCASSAESIRVERYGAAWAPVAASVRLLRVVLRASDSARVAQGRNNGGGGGEAQPVCCSGGGPRGLCNLRDRRGWRLE